MQKSTLVNNIDMAKKLSFIANYGTQGERTWLYRTEGLS